MTKQEKINDRRARRYWLYRFRKSEEEATDPFEDMPTTGLAASIDAVALKTEYESLPVFPAVGGFKKFGISWDIDHDDHSQIIGLEVSIARSWDKKLADRVPNTPIGQGEGHQPTRAKIVEE